MDPSTTTPRLYTVIIPPNEETRGLRHGSASNNPGHNPVSSPDNVDTSSSFVNPEPVIHAARIGADPLQPMADKLDMPADVALDLEPYFRGERIDAITDISDETLKFAERLVGLTTFPPDVVQNEDLVWSAYRCVFSGFGHGLHKQITEMITRKVPYCPWDKDEPLKEWYDAALKARHACGMPLSIIRVPWSAYAKVYPITTGNPPAFDTILDHAARIELARYARHKVDEQGRHLFIWLGGPAELGIHLRHQHLSLAHSFIVAPGAFNRAMHLTPASKSKRNPDYHAPTEAMMRLLGTKTIAQIPPMRPVSGLNPLTLQGPCPRRIEGCPSAGLVPVNMTVEGLWDLRVNQKTGSVTIVPTEQSITTVEADYRPTTLDAGEQNAVFGRRVEQRSLSMAQVLPPHRHILNSFPNLECPITDVDAYAAMLDAMMVVPFMKGHADRSEFPLVFCTPHIPTPEEATDTGKTTLAVGLARVFAPRISEASKFQGQGAPDARAFCAKIIADGTAALDEFIAIQIDNQHPLHESNLLSMALGGAITHGQILSNEAYEAKLRFPLFISAKVVYGQVDLYNRAFLFEMTKIKNADPGTYPLIKDGTWSFNLSIDCRLFAFRIESYVRQAHALLTKSSGDWRYPFTRAAAAVILADREQISLIDAAARIDIAGRSMIDRFTEQLSRAASSGLTTVSTNTSAAQSLKLSHVLDGDLLDEESFIYLTAQPKITIKQLLDHAAKCHGLDSPTDLFDRVFGRMYRTSEQQLSRIITANARKMMPEVGNIWKLTGQRGAEGWALERLADKNGLIMIRITDAHHADIPLDTPPDGSSIPDIKDPA